MSSPSPRTIRLFLYLTVAIACFVAGSVTGYKIIERQYSCVSDYANELADSLEPRQQANEVYQQKQSEVFLATSQLLADPSEYRQRRLAVALAAYETATIDLHDKREANPYPPAPREVC